MKCLLRVPAVVVAVMVASTVSASPFHCDELVSGDLDHAGVHRRLVEGLLSFSRCGVSHAAKSEKPAMCGSAVPRSPLRC